MRSAQKPSAAHSKAAKVQVSPEAAEVSANATVDVLAEPWVAPVVDAAVVPLDAAVDETPLESTV